MTQDECVQLKLIACLLQYPDDAWMDALDFMGGIVDTVADDARKTQLRGFLDYAGQAGSIPLQETYTATFDITPATCLNLTYHMVGDGEDRGKALARLLDIYSRAGYDVLPGELPDYLPMALEFLSTGASSPGASMDNAGDSTGDSTGDYAGFLFECLGVVDTLADRLDKAGNPYAGLFSLLAEIRRTAWTSTATRREKGV